MKYCNFFAYIIRLKEKSKKNETTHNNKREIEEKLLTDYSNQLT